ncbi:leucine rich repeat containing protein BspA family protein, partial [Entamoeba invadens IP1]
MSKLDIYSFQIVSQYFYFESDFINSVLINKKYRLLLDRFRYNPISVSDIKIFPFIEMQHLYTKNDMIIPDIHRLVVWYPVSLQESKTLFSEYDVVFKNVSLSKKDAKNNDVTLNIPQCVNTLGFEFDSHLQVETFVVPDHIKNLTEQLFSYNQQLQEVTLSKCIRRLPNQCFYNCVHLSKIDIPECLCVIEDEVFYKCGFVSFTFPKASISLENHFLDTHQIGGVVFSRFDIHPNSHFN